MKVIWLIWISAIFVDQVVPGAIIRHPRDSKPEALGYRTSGGRRPRHLTDAPSGSSVQTEYEANYQQKGQRGNESFSTVKGKQEILHNNCSDNWNEFAEKCAALIKDLVASLANAISSSPGDTTNLQLQIKNSFKHFDSTNNCSCFNGSKSDLTKIGLEPPAATHNKDSTPAAHEQEDRHSWDSAPEDSSPGHTVPEGHDVGYENQPNHNGGGGKDCSSGSDCGKTGSEMISSFPESHDLPEYELSKSLSGYKAREPQQILGETDSNLTPSGDNFQNEGSPSQLETQFTNRPNRPPYFLPLNATKDMIENPDAAAMYWDSTSHGHPDEAASSLDHGSPISTENLAQTDPSVALEIENSHVKNSGEQPDYESEPYGSGSDGAGEGVISPLEAEGALQPKENAMEGDSGGSNIGETIPESFNSGYDGNGSPVLENNKKMDFGTPDVTSPIKTLQEETLPSHYLKGHSADGENTPESLVAEIPLEVSTGDNQKTSQHSTPLKISPPLLPEETNIYKAVPMHGGGNERIEPYSGVTNFGNSERLIPTAELPSTHEHHDSTQQTSAKASLSHSTEHLGNNRQEPQLIQLAGNGKENPVNFPQGDLGGKLHTHQYEPNAGNHETRGSEYDNTFSPSSDILGGKSDPEHASAEATDDQIGEQKPWDGDDQSSPHHLLENGSPHKGVGSDGISLTHKDHDLHPLGQFPATDELHSDQNAGPGDGQEDSQSPKIPVATTDSSTNSDKDHDLHTWAQAPNQMVTTSNEHDSAGGKSWPEQQQEGYETSAPLRPTTFQTTSVEPTPPQNVAGPTSSTPTASFISPYASKHPTSLFLGKPDENHESAYEGPTQKNHHGHKNLAHEDDDEEEDEDDECCSCESCIDEEIPNPREFRTATCRDIEEAKRELKAIFDKIKKRLKCGRRAKDGNIIALTTPTD